MRQERFDGAREGREICRLGDTVRRPSGPWTPAVHALLRYLESVGFDGAPRVWGIDDEGREVLRFVTGQDGRRVPHPWASLRAVGELIRRFHDAVEGVRAAAGCPLAAAGRRRRRASRTDHHLPQRPGSVQHDLRRKPADDPHRLGSRRARISADRCRARGLVVRPPLHRRGLHPHRSTGRAARTSTTRVLRWVRLA